MTKPFQKSFIIGSLVALLLVTSCDFAPFSASQKVVEASRNHEHPVSQSNPSWRNKELKDRKSPPMSAISQHIDSLVVAIHYSSPSVKGRKIWGNLVEYGEVWRTGADEATMLELSNDAIIGGKEINAGRYALFTIPGEKQWTVIINEVFDQWGAFDYQEKHKAKDVHRFTVEAQEHKFTESLHFRFSPIDEKSIEAEMAWADKAISFPIKLAD